MLTHTRIATLLAAGALLALPATGLADKPENPGSQGKNKSGAKKCAKTPKKAFTLTGTLVNYTADDAATTDVNESSVTLTVTGANSHVKRSGEIADQDATKDGVQVAGATYTVSGAKVVLKGFEGTDTPSAGDRVKVHGRVPVTRKRCAAAGTSTADRFGAPTYRRVTISDRDAD